MRFSRFVPLALLAPIVFGVAACVPRAATPPPVPAPAPAPAPAPTPTPSPVPTFASWMDAPQTPGDWTYAGGTATFGRVGQPRLTMTCAGGTVRIAVLNSNADQLTFRSEAITRAVSASGGAATITPRDPLLDAIALSKGRFAVEAGRETLYVPAWPEVSRVIEDCR